MYGSPESLSDLLMILSVFTVPSVAPEMTNTDPSVTYLPPSRCLHIKPISHICQLFCFQLLSFAIHLTLPSNRTDIIKLVIRQINISYQTNKSHIFLDTPIYFCPFIFMYHEQFSLKWKGKQLLYPGNSNNLFYGKFSSQFFVTRKPDEIFFFIILPVFSALKPFSQEGDDITFHSQMFLFYNQSLPHVMLITFCYTNVYGKTITQRHFVLIFFQRWVIWSSAFNYYLQIPESHTDESPVSTPALFYTPKAPYFSTSWGFTCFYHHH